MNYKKIALLGMMGSGKTSLGLKLAEELKIKRFDLDEIFEASNKIKIRDFFEKYGEDEFRKIESDILEKTLKNDSFVLSTGGGVILSSKNRELLFNGDIFSIYLKTAPGTIFERLKNDSTRPLLLNNDVLGTIEKIISQREEYYSKANYTVKTDDKTLDEIAKEILNL